VIIVPIKKTPKKEMEEICKNTIDYELISGYFLHYPQLFRIYKNGSKKEIGLQSAKEDLRFCAENIELHHKLNEILKERDKQIRNFYKMREKMYPPIPRPSESNADFQKRLKAYKEKKNEKATIT
jgi:hypothetical protein